MREIIYYLLTAYIVILIARAVFSWFPMRQDSPLRTVGRWLERVTEPVLAPVRRIIPPVRMGGTSLDLSFLLVVIVLEVVANAVR